MSVVNYFRQPNTADLPIVRLLFVGALPVYQSHSYLRVPSVPESSRRGRV